MTTLIGIPTYDDTMKTGQFSLLITEGSRPHCPPFTVAVKSSSLLALSHNSLLCLALNNRPEITHLCLLHSDVVPQPGFLALLWEEMVKAQADVLGCVIPIKDGKGLTSTALLPDMGSADMVGRRDFRRRRLTLKEAEQLPETFDVSHVQALYGDTSTNAALLVNTGLMLIDVRKSWVELCHFEINDAIFKNDDGLFYADVEPEDWNFSRQAATVGAKVCVTRRVELIHVGRANFPNKGAWGEWEYDLASVPVRKGETRDPDPVLEPLPQSSTPVSV